MSESAFKSTHPTVLAAVEERNRLAKEWSAQLHAIAQEAFGEDALLHTWGRDTFAGFDHKPVEGWKMGSGKASNVCVPDKRTKVGKQWAKRLDAIKRRPNVECPGMPNFFMGSGDGRGGVYFREPAWDVMDGVAWCRWGERPPVECEIDAEMWTEVRLSEFYAALEAAEALATERGAVEEAK